MRTAHSLTVSRIICRGVYLVQGCTWLGGEPAGGCTCLGAYLPGGVPAQGGTRLGGVPAQGDVPAQALPHCVQNS